MRAEETEDGWVEEAKDERPYYKSTATLKGSDKQEIIVGRFIGRH
jgi:hypothetical protein